jgi:hypothetical protein
VICHGTYRTGSPNFPCYYGAAAMAAT